MDGATMSHVVLLGDSIFDNAAYTRGGPAVIDQVTRRLPSDWRATLAAVDGATTSDIPRQMRTLAHDATHLVLSVGGNDALRHAGILDMRVTSGRAAFAALAQAVQMFARSYDEALAACLRPRLPLVLCTIYNGNFPGEEAAAIAVALNSFNDAIISGAIRHRLSVLELRLICSQPEDYANPIEPSSTGGEKIARAIVNRIMGDDAQRGACIFSI